MQNPSPEHQKLVAALIEHFKSKLGYVILSASHSGYNDPEKHGRHEPDIVAKDSRGVLHLAEAKVGDDIFSENSKEQFVDFSNRIMTGTNTPVPFHIIVYKEDEPALISRLNQLGLGNLIGNKITIWTL
ncbi:MAG: hypothetical protein NTY81_04130 [Candidatus Staskawiczbacteria bacterium]|nr:hypothetical protein [Candidatus Staskawiczbacteria bacterium]